ncbi:hypothetical protein OROHE_017498 [Orobanche hederae]
MLAKKDRLPPGYSSSFAPHYESDGSGCSGRIGSIEDSSAPTRKWIDLNSASKDGFAVPVQIIPLSKLSSSERKSLVLRLTSELDQIRLLQNKIGLQKKKAANAITKSSSSDILNSNDAQLRELRVCTAKKPSGSGPGPGKKRVGGNRSITGRFQSSTKNTRVNANVGLLKQCESLLKKLTSQQYAWVFNTPVDVVKLNIPDYFDVIKKPMDLGTIKSKLTSGKYSSPWDFLADVRLTFTNANTYNPPGSDVHIMANTMSQFFELRWKAIEKKLVMSTSCSLPLNSGILEETEINKPLIPSKKRKLSPRSHELMHEPMKRRMTDGEKHKLSSELEGFIGDLPDSIIDFLRAHTTNKGDGGEDEIEIDIDELSDDTLFTLQNLLDDHSQDKHNSLARSEACEIELPNVSGLSNSSLQIDKGNDLIDKDVDIGGNEDPVSICQPVSIDRDTGGRAEECNEAGPESDGGSECSKGSLDLKQSQDHIGQIEDSDKKLGIDEMVGPSPVNGPDQLEQGLQLKPCSSDSYGQLDGKSAQNERQVSPDKLYRAALLKNRFADTILKAREKALLSQDDKADPEKLRREKEELEMHKRREKVRLQAEAKAAEDARRRAEVEAAAEAKKRRELEREAAREALLMMEKTVEINENSRFLEDLDMLRNPPPEQLHSSVEESSPEQSQDGPGFGNFTFGGSNPLEQLGLYMKVDEEEEGEPPSILNATGDVEEGEID